MYRRRSTRESARAFDRTRLPDEVRQVDIHQAAASSDSRVTANDTRLLKRIGDARRRGAATICTPIGKGWSGTGTATTGRPMNEISWT